VNGLSSPTEIPLSEIGRKDVVHIDMGAAHCDAWF
jgi:hypothetical protein